MWEQQLLNDPLTTSQLEASEALGKLPFSETVLTCLARVLRNHTLHPLVRTFSAQALKRLHNENVDTHEGTYLSILLNYLYMYHYRSVCSFVGVYCFIIFFNIESVPNKF
jgi:hypothetical protein